MTPLRPEVERCSMRHDPVVPECDRVGFPPEAHLGVHVATDLQEQEAQDGVRLSLGNADDAARESWVDVDALPAGGWMNADDGVNRLDGFAADVQSGSAGTISLGDSAVESGKAFQVDLHPRAERRVQGIPRTPEGVTPTFRGGDDFEGRRARGLDLVRYITVPEF